MTDARGGLPLLAPMSEVAGRMAIQVGAGCLEKERGGMGTLLAGVPGVPAAKIVILGAGVGGRQRGTHRGGNGARVFVLDRSVDALGRIESDSALAWWRSTRAATRSGSLVSADLVIGAVLVPGAAAPRLVPRALLARMKPGAAMVDVSVDQGGCSDLAADRAANRTYVVDGVVHYCVPTCPAPWHTSTYALCNATLPFVLALTDAGSRKR